MMPRPEPVTFHHRLGAKVASSLGRGAILLLPLLVTFWLVKFAYDKLDGFFQPFISSVFGQEVPGLSVAIIMIVLLSLDALARLSCSELSVISSSGGSLRRLGWAPSTPPQRS